MATELVKNPHVPVITADGDYFVAVRNSIPFVVAINFTAGTGTITIKNAQGRAYRDEGDTADLAVTNASTVVAYKLYPTGGHVNFTASSFTGASAQVNVVEQLQYM